METNELREHKSYLGVLKSRLDAEGSRPGYKTALSAAAGFSPSFLSHVVKGKGHLAPEHAVGIAQFWNLGMDDTEYFVELVNLARATEPKMRAYVELRLEQIRKRGERKLLKGAARPLASDWSKSVYYSSWHYSAIHIATTIPAFQTSTAIAKRLEVPVDLVERTLVELQSMNLVAHKGARWEATEANLGAIGDHNARSYGVHWGVRSLQDIQVRRDPRSLFRSSVYGVSRSVFKEMRQEMVQFIRKFDDLAIPSPGEELVCSHWHLFMV
jgi:uncharacterized protein (TIGR02147 family)